MSPISNFARIALACTVAALLGGCVIAGDVRPYPAMAPIQPIMPPQAEPTAGAIYAAGPTLQLYSDRRARDVGDLLTITLLENTTAQTSANTATNKESNLSLARRPSSVRRSPWAARTSSVRRPRAHVTSPARATARRATACRAASR